jgi:hypothetical protein
MGDWEHAWREVDVPRAASSLGAFEALAATRSAAPQPHGGRLGELLVDEGLLTADELKQVLAEQRKTGRRLGEIIFEHGFASVPTLVKLLGQQGQLELQAEGGFGSGLRRAIEDRHRTRRGSDIGSGVRAPVPPLPQTTQTTHDGPSGRGEA